MEGKTSSSSTSSSSSRSLGSSISMKNQQKRTVETAWKSLDLERNHFMKLMALNEKLLRSRQEKREDRMARLRSHLTVPQIIEIENARGVHEPKRSTAASSSSLDIERGSGARDSPDGVTDGGINKNNRSIESSLSIPGRSNSFYSYERTASRRAEASEGGRDRASTSKETVVVERKEKSSSYSAPKLRGKSSESHNAFLPITTHPPSRAKLTSDRTGLSRSSNNLDTVDIRKTSRFRSSSSLASPSTFSCHEERKRDMGRRRSQSVSSPVRSRTPTFGSSSGSSSTSVFQDAIDAMKKERTRTDLRHLMVIENDLQYMQLQRRKEALMSNIDDMIKRDRELAQNRRIFLPPTEPTRVSLTTLTQAELIESAYQGVDMNDLRKEIRRRKQERMKERMKMDIPADQLKRKDNETEEDYAKRLEKWWRDMRKVRYLRRQSTKPDLSDVVTLAMAQQNNNKIWRQSLRDNLF